MQANDWNAADETLREIAATLAPASRPRALGDLPKPRCSTGCALIAARCREESDMSTHRDVWLSVVLLTAVEAATLCRRSARTWRSWNAGGLVPRPVRVGRSLLWRADELKAWVDADCPRRDVWDARRK